MQICKTDHNKRGPSWEAKGIKSENRTGGRRGALEEKASERVLRPEPWGLLILIVQGPVSASIAQADGPPQG